MDKRLYHYLQITDIKDMLNKTKELYGERPAYKIRIADSQYKIITHREVREMVDALGTAICNLGLKGKRIAIIGENRYEWEIAYLSVVYGTGIVVPLDKSLPKNELEILIERSNIEAIFDSEKYSETIEQIKNNNNSKLKYLISMDLDKHSNGIYSQKELIETGKKLLDKGNKEFIAAQINPEEMNIMLFTSGTTSVSKVVALSHKNICSNLMDLASVLDVTSEDILLSNLPLHHVFECTVGFLFALYIRVNAISAGPIKTLSAKSFQKRRKLFIIFFIYDIILKKGGEYYMKKKLKILLIILLSIILVWGVIFAVDYFRCLNLKMPIFVIPGETADNGGSGTYFGLGYSVEVEKNISAEYGVQMESIEMYIFDNCIGGAIACFDNELTNTEGITTALTLEDEITNDTIWCGTFQLIWNDLKNDLAKQDIVFTPQLQVVENLNKETFTTKDISEKYYYKKVGVPSLALKKEIEKAIKDKFNETSDILDDFEWENRNPKDYFLYSMLKKEFKFKKAFEELSNGSFGEYENVKFFGIESSDKDELRKQVNVLYYNSEDDFAIKLNTKQEDEVILCKNPEGKSFNEIYKNIKDNEKNYTGKKYMTEDDYLKVPNIKLKEKTEFTEIQDKPYEFSNGDTYRIEKAIQTIEFELDRTGGRIKSEAGMMNVQESAMIVDIPRIFYIDDTFAIFLIEEDKDVPYFAGLINDITKFQ